ncbi:hypothetical protein PCE1_000220 [Barthelona sp. PCE]
MSTKIQFIEHVNEDLEKILKHKRRNDKVAHEEALLKKIMNDVCDEIEKRNPDDELQKSALEFFKNHIATMEPGNRDGFLPRSAVTPFGKNTTKQSQIGLIYVDSRDFHIIADDLNFFVTQLEGQRNDIFEGKTIVKNLNSTKMAHLRDRCYSCRNYINTKLINRWDTFKKKCNEGLVDEKDFIFWMKRIRNSISSNMESTHLFQLDGNYVLCSEKWEEKMYKLSFSKIFVPEKSIPPAGWPRTSQWSLINLNIKDNNPENRTKLNIELKKLFIVGFWIIIQGSCEAILPIQISKYLAELNMHTYVAAECYDQSIDTIDAISDLLCFSKNVKGKYQITSPKRSSKDTKLLQCAEQARYVYCKQLCKSIVEEGLPVHLMLDKWTPNTVKDSIMAIMIKIPTETKSFNIDHPIFSNALFISHDDVTPIHYEQILSTIRNKFILLDVHFDMKGKHNYIFNAIISTVFRFGLHKAKQLYFISDRGLPELKALNFVEVYFKGIGYGNNLVIKMIDSIVERYSSNTGADRFSSQFNEHDYLDIVSSTEIVSEEKLKGILLEHYLHNYKVPVLPFNCMSHMVNNFIRCFVPVITIETRGNYMRVEPGTFQKQFTKLVNYFSIQNCDIIYNTERNKSLICLIDCFLGEYFYVLKTRSEQEAEENGIPMKEKPYRNMSATQKEKEKKRWSNSLKDRMPYKWYNQVTQNNFDHFFKETLNFNIGYYEESVFDEAIRRVLKEDEKKGWYKDYASHTIVPIYLEDLFEHIRQLFIANKEQVAILRRVLPVWSNLYGKTRVIFQLFFETLFEDSSKFNDNFAKAFAITDIFKQIESIINDPDGDPLNTIYCSFTEDELRWVLFFCFVVRRFKKLSLLIEQDSFTLQQTIIQFHSIIRDIQEYDISMPNSIPIIDKEVPDIIEESPYSADLPSSLLTIMFDNVNDTNTMHKDKATRIKANLKPSCVNDLHIHSAVRCCMRGFEEMKVKDEKENVIGTVKCDSGASLGLLEDVKTLVITAFAMYFDRCANNKFFFKQYVASAPFWFAKVSNNAFSISLCEDLPEFLNTPATTCPVERVFSHYAFLESQMGKATLHATLRLKMRLHRSLHHWVCLDSARISDYSEHVDEFRFRELEELARKRTSSNLFDNIKSESNNYLQHSLLVESDDESGFEKFDEAS